MVFTLSASGILVYVMMHYNDEQTAALYPSSRSKSWNAPTALFTIPSRQLLPSNTEITGIRQHKSASLIEHIFAFHYRTHSLR